MGVWLCHIHMKLKSGKVVSSKERFKLKSMLTTHLNQLMDTGKYLSCGASIKWTTKPMPPIFPEQCRCAHNPCRCKRHPDNGLIYAPVTLESHYSRVKAKSKLHGAHIVRTDEVYDPCPNCNGAGGILRQSGRSEEADSPPVQQAQPVHSFCVHGTKLGKCYKCKLEAMCRAQSAVVVEEEHRCC